MLSIPYISCGGYDTEFFSFLFASDPDLSFWLMCVYYSLQSLNNKDSAESRWKPGAQGRGSRGGQGNFAPRYTAHGKTEILEQKYF